VTVAVAAVCKSITDTTEAVHDATLVAGVTCNSIVVGLAVVVCGALV